MKKKKALPDWFNWYDYAKLGAVHDQSIWAYLFASRDKNQARKSQYILALPKKINVGLATDSNFLDSLPRMVWNNGFLFYHESKIPLPPYSDYIINRYCQKFEILTGDKFRSLQQKNKLKKGEIYRSLPHDRYVHFKNEHELQTFEEFEKSVLKNTLDFTVNMNLPKDILVNEFKRFVTDFHAKRNLPIKVKKLNNKTALSWARGLACWDLIDSDSNFNKPHLLAELLCPLWGIIDEKKAIQAALEAVTPLIDEGEWIYLTGDPAANYSKNQ